MTVLIYGLIIAYESILMSYYFLIYICTYNYKLMLYTNYFYASYGGKIKMNKLLSKKPVPLYIEAYLCSPSEELANVIIDIVDIVPFSNISYPVKAARGMVDPNVTEDKVNKVIYSVRYTSFVSNFNFFNSI